MEKLPLDSQIFLFDVYKTDNVEDWMPGLTYLMADKKVCGLTHTDEKVELELDLQADIVLSVFRNKTEDLHKKIGFLRPKDNDELSELAILAGKNSRFYLDEHTRPNADEMYKIWIRNHIENERHKYPDFLTLYISGKDRMVAFIALQEDRISLISRLPEYKKQGLAHALISAAIFECRTKGYSKLKVATQRRNTSALNLYDAIGFKEVSSKFVYHFWKEKE